MGRIAYGDGRVRADGGGMLRGGRRLAFFFITSTMLGSASLFFPVISHAQQRVAEQTRFDIPAQPLSAAIASFIRATEWDVGFTSATVSGKRSAAVSGTMTPAQALQAMLAGTGVSADISGPSTAALVSGSGGAAQRAPVNADGSLVLDTITISGGGNPADAPYRSSGSGAYISAQQIERFRGTSTGDMLKSTPGVIASANRNGASLEVNIRGVQGMNRVKVTVDGSEQTIAEGQGYPGSRTRSYIDPDLIAGVEIEKGPQMSGAGAGAIGGAVNMRTLDVQDILKDGKQFGVRLKGGLMSNNRPPPPTGTTTFRNDPTSLFDFDNLNGSVAAAATLGGIDLVAAYSRRRHGNYFAGRHGKSTYADDWGNEQTYSLYRPGSEVLNTGLETESFLLKSGFSFLEDHKVQLSWLRSDFSYGETWPSDLLYGALKQNDPRKTRTNRLTAKYEWDPAENDAIRLRANVYYADTNDEGAAYAFAKPYTSQNYGFDVENVSQFHFGALGSLALTYGGSYAVEDLNSSQGRVNGSNFFFEGRRDVASLYAKADWNPTDWLALNAGLRYLSYKTQDNSPVSGSYGEFNDLSGSSFSPGLGARLEPWDGIQFFAQYNEGYRPPSLRESVSNYDTSLVPNPFLKAEHARNLEAGINLLRDDVLVGGDKLRVKGVFFNNDIDDYIMRLWPKSSAYFMMDNIDRARFSGIELSAKYDTGTFFVDGSFTYFTKADYCYVWTRWETQPDGTNQQVESDVCSSTPPDVDFSAGFVQPRFTGSVTAGARFMEEKLTVGGRVSYVGTNPVANFAPWPSYTLVDLFASYKVSDSFRVDVAADNIFDRYYLDALSNNAVVAPGRTFRLDLTAKF
ncbi:hemoglobin/transferrin/lactoferrin receptor protein [Aquamicrobium lusatiense]|uniref:Hemoglobin/transferrin/lactoferrin receptor protein n=1 Tax=Aquamicrobium lusatiense TaxID=89772 RepID=A0A7W9S6V6_9HYPH|nr:TonB-dependent receptor [Aquamicrobium lusatiense]MBB6014113.1 hemoglobin/transferrin/lactoferrin receptor protein [Aquamicrobium lusatiense]